MDVFGITLPLWTVFVGAILLIIVLWKFIKFAIKLLIVVIVFFVILIGLDVVGVFDTIQQIFQQFI